jgi:ankyrin repeat protein
VAVIGGYKDIVELLATKKANLNIKNKNGFAPLHYAVSTRRLSWWEIGTGESSTPNDLAITELLITHGADVNMKSDNGTTPLSLAKRGSKAEIVELLRKHGAME